MNIKQLEYFVKVAEFGSFSRAAETLDMGQSALSKQVRMLEVELRQALLDRTGRGVVPTAAGRLVLEHGRGILNQVARVHEDLADLRGALAGRVNLGMPPSIARVIAAPLILEVRRQLPHVIVAVSESMAKTLQECVHKGSLDAAFLYNGAPSPDLKETLLLEEEVLLVQLRPVPGSAPLPPEASLLEVAHMPQVISTRPNTLRLLVENELAAHGIKMEIAFEVDGSHTILDLVAHGAGAALLPRRVVETSGHAGRVVMRSVPRLQLRSRLSMVVSTQRPTTLAQQAVLEIIVPLARELLS